MAHLRKKFGITCIIFTLFVCVDSGVTPYAKTPESKLEALKIIAIKPPVSIIRNGENIAVKKWGLALEDNDEIETGVGGKAYIILSLLSEGNEIYLAPLTKVHLFSNQVSKERTIHYVNIIYGKIRADVSLTPKQEIRINALSGEIVTNNGEFIVSLNKGVADIGTIRGVVKMFSISTNRLTIIPEQSMLTVYQGRKALSPLILPKQLTKKLIKAEKEDGDHTGE